MSDPRDPRTEPGAAEQGASAGEQPSAGAAAPTPPAPPRRLLRYPDQAPLGGVAEGLGVHLGVDPVLPRIVFVLLALFGGGFGLLLYLILLLVIPKAHTAVPTDQVVSPTRTRTWVGALLIAVGGIVLLGQLAALPGLAFFGLEGLGNVLTSGAVLALLLIGGGVALLLLDRRDPDADAAGAAPGDGPPAAAGTEPARSPAAPSTPAAAPPAGTATTQQLASPTAPTQGAAQGSTEATSAAPGPPPQAPPSRLGRLTAGVLLVVLGGAWLADQVGVASVGATEALALALLVIGGGLVVGGFWGRSRGLIAWGVVVAVLLLTVGTVQVGLDTARTTFGDGVGDRSWTPATLAEVEDRYGLGLGDAELDLSAVDFAGEEREITATVGAGTLAVTVPADVDVTVRGTVNAGELDLFGQRTSGAGQVSRTVSDTVDDPDGALELETSVGAGEILVERD